MKLVLSTGVFEVELVPLIPLLREAGFRYLEVVDRAELDNKALDELLRVSKVYEVEILNWHLIQESPFQETADAMKSAIDRMKQSIARGYRVGAMNHILHWYHRFRDGRYDILWRDIVNEWVDYAKHLGVRLLMETPPYYPQYERYVPSSEVIDFVRNYPPEVMSICLDVNHTNLKENLTEVIPTLVDRLVSLHISDNDGHREQHWLPGRGVIDFSSLFDSLAKVKFEGLFVIEVNKWCEKPDDIDELKKLYKFAMDLLETHTPHLDILLPSSCNEKE